MSRSELKKSKKRSVKSKLIILSVSLITLISIAFTVYVFNGLLSTKELLTSKSKTIYTEQSEKPNHYANELEKESKMKEEMEKKSEKEPEQNENEQLYKDYETYQNASNEEESYSYTYTVDSVENNEIYASSMQEGDVYFTQSLVKDNVELSVGDTILVNFSNNEMDSITSVELVFSVSEYQQEQTEAEIQNDKVYDELEKRTEELKREVNKNYNDVMGNRNDSSFNVKEYTITNVNKVNGLYEYTATSNDNTDEISFTSDKVYNGHRFAAGDNATVIYDENGSMFEVNDGIMSDEMILAEDGHYVSPSFYQ
ncbi:hypothetical protein AAXE64_08370 [Priestia megaterium]